jgi:hypothetical protein
MKMARRIQIKRGLYADMPVLAVGELAYCTDIKKLFVGTAEGINKEVTESSQVEVTWQELKDLRDSSALVPGREYRITDYVTTTVQENTRSAGHQFDIIVTADDVDKLNENARATHKKKELLPWFEHSKSDPAERYFYVDSVVIEGLTLYRWVSYEELNAGDWTDGQHRTTYLLTEKRDVVIGDVVWGWQSIDDGEYRENDYEEGSDETKTIINVGEGYMPGSDYFANSKLEAWKLKYCLDNDTSRFAWADEVNGKGVIYRMIDEFNNDVPYDFKNIQFKRDLFYDRDYDITFTDIYFYTFSAYSFALATGVQSDIEDATIITKQEGIDDFFNNCHDNVIKPLFSTQYAGTIDVPTWELSNNLLINRYAIGDTYFNCYSNTFGSDCHSNTFGSDCYSNTFGNGCSHNTFDDNCRDNTFGNSCSNNTFGDGCSDNTFSDDCSNNTFDYNCRSNTFGNSCSSNTFGNNCDSNTFGDYCFYNTFGDDCYYNNFGNNCGSNTFGDDCYSNTFGDSCSFNTFGDSCSFNTFGNYCGSNTFGDGYRSNTFGNDCQYLKISDNTDIQKKHISVDNGFNGASSVNRFDLYDPAILNKDYQVTFKKSASGKYLMLWATDTGTMTGKVKDSNVDDTWEDIV